MVTLIQLNLLKLVINTYMNNRIIIERVAKGWTQEVLAAKVGVRRETIVFLEQGKYNPSLKLAAGLAKEFGLKLEVLFDLDS